MTTFDLKTFIRESNLIDPQYDLRGRLIPGAAPGDPMYDTTLAAWELMMDVFRVQRALPPSVALDIHRELTRGIETFEYHGMSGQYRIVPVTIGGAPPFYKDGEVCPPPVAVKEMIEQLWVPQLNRTCSAPTLFRAEKTIWAHDFFQCVHPFWDGNGRSGRILYNLARVRTGMNPLVIAYDRRQTYFNRIRKFRADSFYLEVARLRALDAPGANSDVTDL